MDGYVGKGDKRTWMKVRPSSRKRRNGTSESIGLRSSDQPAFVRNWDPVTAQIGVWTPGMITMEGIRVKLTKGRVINTLD